MDKITEEVKNDVARLLAMIANDGTNPKAYEFVLEKLTKMVIISVPPAGCRLPCGPRTGR